MAKGTQKKRILIQRQSNVRTLKTQAARDDIKTSQIDDIDSIQIVYSSTYIKSSFMRATALIFLEFLMLYNVYAM